MGRAAVAVPVFRRLPTETWISVLAFLSRLKLCQITLCSRVLNDLIETHFGESGPLILLDFVAFDNPSRCSLFASNRNMMPRTQTRRTEQIAMDSLLNYFLCNFDRSPQTGSHPIEKIKTEKGITGCECHDGILLAGEVSNDQGCLLELCDCPLQDIIQHLRLPFVRSQLTLLFTGGSGSKFCAAMLSQLSRYSHIWDNQAVCLNFSSQMPNRSLLQWAFKTISSAAHCGILLYNHFLWPVPQPLILSDFPELLEENWRRPVWLRYSSNGLSTDSLVNFLHLPAENRREIVLCLNESSDARHQFCSLIRAIGDRFNLPHISDSLDTCFILKLLFQGSDENFTRRQQFRIVNRNNDGLLFCMFKSRLNLSQMEIQEVAVVRCARERERMLKSELELSGGYSMGQAQQQQPIGDSVAQLQAYLSSLNPQLV